MKWNSLTVMGRLIILTLLALAAIGVLGAQDGKQTTESVPHSSVALATKDAVPTMKELKPTEVQSLRLQVRQKDALLAKANLEQAQRQFQQALTDLTNEGEKVKVENGWPKDVQFDPNGLGFSPPPVKDAKKEK